jgi:Putative death-receptor fusion protein (DUF2428)
VPSLIVGLLLARTDNAFFAKVFEDLRVEAESPVAGQLPAGASLPQVHALNCIKDIFTNAKLAASSDPYLSSGIELAVKCLASDTYVLLSL